MYVVLGSLSRTSETRIIDPVCLIRGLRHTRFSTPTRLHVRHAQHAPPSDGESATILFTQAISPSLVRTTNSMTSSPGSTPTHIPTNSLLQVTATSR